MSKAPKSIPIKPPNPLAYIRMGFQLVVAKPYLLVLPILLDLFYWIGPKLRNPQAFLASLGIQEQLLKEVLGEDPASRLEQLNWFWSLNPPLLGVPSVMSGKRLTHKVINSPEIRYVDSSDFLLGTIGLTFIGVLLVGVYYYSIGRAVNRTVGFSSAGLFWTMLNLIGLALSLLVLVILPLWVVLILVSLTLPVIGTFILVLLGVATFLMFFYLSYTIQGIVLAKLDLFDAMVASRNFVRQYRQVAIPVMFVCIGLKMILNQLVWFPLIDGNWATAVNIVGHAFVTVAITLAPFFAYQPYAINLRKQRT